MFLFFLSNRLLLWRCCSCWGSAWLHTVAGDDLRFDEQHLDLLTVELGSLNIRHFVIMIRSHRIHRYQVGDRLLTYLTFLNLKLKRNDPPLEALGQ